VESLARQHSHLVLDALCNSQTVEADESVGDVVTETPVVNEPHKTPTGVVVADRLRCQLALHCHIPTGNAPERVDRQ